MRLEVSAILTYDRRLGEAARSAGLDVICAGSVGRKLSRRSVDEAKLRFDVERDGVPSMIHQRTALTFSSTQASTG